MNTSKTTLWPGADQILEMAGNFRPACILGAAAELDLFSRLGKDSRTAEQVAALLESDPRAVQILLDALAALRLLDKQGEQYCVPEPVRPLLDEAEPNAILPMVRHMMSMLRAWSQLAWVVKAGFPGPRQASIRGFQEDRAAFIAAMHAISCGAADDVVGQLAPLCFKRLLDVGGASGTWTLAFLRAVPGATATIFDLPDAIEQARHRLCDTAFGDRVVLAAGDFYRDELPGGVDFAWISAIAHQHSRKHNRELFAKAWRALVPGGTIAIRDIVMEPSRTAPLDGAVFAVNMLVQTDSGGTFTFEELSEDLQSAGFVEPVLRSKTNDMRSIVTAKKP
jgi:SAM-dependent methyltransferase